jgi:hypothetical protein
MNIISSPVMIYAASIRVVQSVKIKHLTYDNVNCKKNNNIFVEDDYYYHSLYEDEAH